MNPISAAQHSRTKLVALIADVGTKVCGLLRQKGTPHDELKLGSPQWTEEGERTGHRVAP